MCIMRNFAALHLLVKVFMPSNSDVSWVGLPIGLNLCVMAMLLLVFVLSWVDKLVSWIGYHSEVQTFCENLSSVTRTSAYIRLGNLLRWIGAIVWIYLIYLSFILFFLQIFIWSQEPSSVEKIMEIDGHIGCAMSGLIADARTLVEHARVETQVWITRLLILLVPNWTLLI